MIRIMHVVAQYSIYYQNFLGFLVSEVMQVLYHQQYHAAPETLGSPEEFNCRFPRVPTFRVLTQRKTQESLNPVPLPDFVQVHLRPGSDYGSAIKTDGSR